MSPAQDSKLTVRAAVKRKKVVVRGLMEPPHPIAAIEVGLQRRS